MAGFDFNFDIGEVLEEVTKQGAKVGGTVLQQRLARDRRPSDATRTTLDPGVQEGPPPRNDPPPTQNVQAGNTAQPPPWYEHPAVLVGGGLLLAAVVGGAVYASRS